VGGLRDQAIVRSNGVVCEVLGNHLMVYDALTTICVGWIET